jgi:aminomethyltransferase
MPLQYTSPVAEHVAVRTTAGAFDVSHMGQVELLGPGAQALLELLSSNDVGRMAIGAAQYSLLCRDGGGVLDDVISYRLGAERYLTVTNAANHERDLAWFQEHAGPDVEVLDRAAEYAMIAVQGPLAREFVQAVADAPLPERMTVAPGRLAGAEALIAGTGYTGEDGVELLLAPSDAERVWQEVVRRGAVPAGLVARDTLRTEACFPLYGNELTLDRGPIEAGLGWACRPAGGYLGAAAVERARERGPAEKLVAFVLAEGIARAGNAVVGGGVVTSGTFSPSLQTGIGLAYVPAERATAGTSIELDVRGRRRAARIERKPLLRLIRSFGGG